MAGDGHGDDAPAKMVGGGRLKLKLKVKRPTPEVKAEEKPKSKPKPKAKARTDQAAREEADSLLPMADLLSPVASYNNFQMDYHFNTNLRQALNLCYKAVTQVKSPDGKGLCATHFMGPPEDADLGTLNSNKPTIWLDQIAEKIETGLYRDLPPLAEDVRMLTNNVRVLYPDDSIRYRQAVAMQEALAPVYETELRRMRRERALLNLAKSLKDSQETTAKPPPKDPSSKATSFCPICSQTFAVRSSISRHLKRKHGLSPEQAKEMVRNQVERAASPSQAPSTSVPATPSAADQDASASTPSKRPLALNGNRLPDQVDPKVEAVVLEAVRTAKDMVTRSKTPATVRPARATMFIVKMGKSIYPQAALKILQECGHHVPMHYIELTRLAQEKGYVTSVTSTTPGTMNSQLNRCLDFYPTGDGFFGLCEWRDDCGVVPGPPVAGSGSKAAEEGVGEHPTDEMVHHSEASARMLPPPELTAIIAMELAVERQLRLSSLVPVLEAVVAQQEAELVRSRMADYECQVHSAKSKVDKLRQDFEQQRKLFRAKRAQEEAAKAAKAKQAKLEEDGLPEEEGDEDDMAPPGSSTDGTAGKTESDADRRARSMYDYWRDEFCSPSLRLLKTHHHHPPQADGPEHYVTRMPWLQRALGYDMMGDAV